MTVGLNQNTGIIPNTVRINNNPLNNAANTDKYIPQGNYPVVSSQYLLVYIQPQPKDAPLTRDQKVMLFNSMPNEDKMEMVTLSRDLMYGYYPVILGHLPAAPESKMLGLSAEKMNIIKKYKKFFETKDIKLIFPRDEVMNRDDLVMVNVPEAREVIRKNIDTFRNGLGNPNLTVDQIADKFMDTRNNLLNHVNNGSVNEEMKSLLLGFPPRDAYFEKLRTDACFNKINKQEVYDKYKQYSVKDKNKPSPHTKILGLVCSTLNNDKYSTEGNASNPASVLVYYLLSQHFRKDITEEQKQILRPAMNKIDELLKAEGIDGLVGTGFYNNLYMSSWDTQSKEMNKSRGKRDIVNKIYAKNFDTAAKCFWHFVNN